MKIYVLVVLALLLNLLMAAINLRAKDKTCKVYFEDNFPVAIKVDNIKYDLTGTDTLAPLFTVKVGETVNCKLEVN